MPSIRGASTLNLIISTTRGWGVVPGTWLIGSKALVVEELIIDGQQLVQWSGNAYGPIRCEALGQRRQRERGASGKRVRFNHRRCVGQLKKLVALRLSHRAEHSVVLAEFQPRLPLLGRHVAFAFFKKVRRWASSIEQSTTNCCLGVSVVS